MEARMQEPNYANTARGTARFVPLRAESAVGSLFERSHVEPVTLFQHDPYCPISHRAYRELTGVPIEVPLVDVAHDADITRAIEERTGVPHEAPHVLVLRSGRVVWSASPFPITRGATCAGGAAPAPAPSPRATKSRLHRPCRT